MTLDEAKRIASEVYRLTGHKEIVVIGSNAALGVSSYADIPPAMTQSTDLDAYLRLDPNRTGTLFAHVGEESEFHRRTGTYLDTVSPALVTAPDGWEQRMLSVAHEGLRLWFLDPSDAAVSKLARGEERDLRWVRAGIEAGIIPLPTLRARLAATRFLNASEDQRATERLNQLSPLPLPAHPTEDDFDLGF